MSSTHFKDDDGTEIIKRHALPWLSSSVYEFKRRIDDVCLRVEGELSIREMPSKEKFPPWAFI